MVLENFRTQLQVPFFMEIIILMSWSIWTTRNNFIFEGRQPSISSCLERFQSVLTLLLHRVKEDTKQAILQWMELYL